MPLLVHKLKAFNIQLWSEKSPRKSPKSWWLYKIKICSFLKFVGTNHFNIYDAFQIGMVLSLSSQKLSQLQICLPSLFPAHTSNISKLAIFCPESDTKCDIYHGGVFMPEVMKGFLSTFNHHLSETLFLTTRFREFLLWSINLSSNAVV